MYARLLVVIAGVGFAVAHWRPTPRNQLEADIWAAVDPVYNWNDDFWAMTGDNHPPDKWHGPDGKSNVTHAIVDEFYKVGVAAWKTAGTKMAELVKRVDTSSVTPDYTTFLASLFPDSFDTAIPWRLSVYWNSQLNITEDEVKVWAAQYDAAWLDAILAVEAVHASVTQDHIVSYPMFWDAPSLRGDFFYKVADHKAAVPWQPVVRYCNHDNYGNKCNNGLNVYPPNQCYSTADIGVQAKYIGVGNGARGFPWVCQTYTDNACQTEVLVPALVCPYEPPLDIYCDDTKDWDGKFGAGNPPSTAYNPSDVFQVDVNSFKCAPA